MDPQVSVKYNKIPTAIPIIPTTNPKNIGYDTKKIWTEYQLINRLLYRSRNQHKSSLSFQHLKEVNDFSINNDFFITNNLGKKTW